MHLSKPEILLALRSPDSHWLGVLITMLDEAKLDPSFDAAQRAILHQLLDAGTLAPEVARAARRRAGAFEAQIMQDCGLSHASDTGSIEEDAQQRPKLTLVGNVGS